MVEILIAKVHSVQDSEVEMLSALLPEFMRKEILRYRFVEDQKSRLLARLMLRQCLIEEGSLTQLQFVTRTAENKPVLAGWKWFNISHAGDYAVFCTSRTPIGIDIELRIPLDYKSILADFHPAERQALLKAPDAEKAFFDIWVKKEALLKAMGIGIVNGLRDYDCSGNTISVSGVIWKFCSLSLHDRYTGFYCTTENIENTNIKCFSLQGEGDKTVLGI